MQSGSQYSESLGNIFSILSRNQVLEKVIINGQKNKLE